MKIVIDERIFKEKCIKCENTQRRREIGKETFQQEGESRVRQKLAGELRCRPKKRNLK